MILKEINNTLILVWNHKFARISFLLIIFIALLLSIFFSIFSSIIIIVSYFCGSLVSFCLIKYRFEFGFLLQRLVSYYKGDTLPKKRFNNCTICDNLNCNRHQNAPLKEPWKGLLVSEELNTSIENFFNKILDNYISSWYTNLTDDLLFVNELRSTVRFACCCLIQRYLDIDTGNIISNKLIPCGVRHIDDCIQIQEKSEQNNIKIETAAVSYLGCRLHTAVTSRENELNYLRSVTEKILPKILNKSQLNCKSFNLLIRELISGWVFLPLMDVISDPNTMNFLLNITVTYKRKPNKHNNHFERVELLYNFVNYKDLKKAALGFELTKIFKQPDYLYAFMQFLKEDGPVNILQFCLDVEEFNRKLLTPELSKKELENLYSEATQIYNLYLKEDSHDYIRCSKDICFNFERLLQGGPNNIDKLRTSTPLFKAYDFAFNILDTQWLPIFFHSDEFYTVVCGSKITSNYSKSPINRFLTQSQGSPIKNRTNKKPENNSGPVSKLSSSINKIKSTLRNQPIEGSVLNEPDQFESEPPMFIEEPIYRDLSTWRVSITCSEQVYSSKPGTNFCISVKRIDSCLESERFWTVKRQDQDFYTLKIKLVEFHGENEICDSPLPSRRLSTTSEMRRQKYEEFLQRLLQKNTLRSSDLLYTFLTTKENFTLLADTSVPIVSDLEYMYQSVAHKLRKEKGQHLENFMKTFFMSTETSETNKNPDVGEEADTGLIFEKSTNKPRNIKNTLFEDNFEVNITENCEYSPPRINPQDIIECSYYLLKNIFHVPKPILKLFSSICSISSQAAETLTRFLIEKHLKSALNEHTLSHLINLLQETLFEHKTDPSTALELQERKITAFNHLAKLNKGFCCYCMGLEVNEGLTNLLQILQHPQLNKQLAYSLLDILILELFPDCELT